MLCIPILFMSDVSVVERFQNYTISSVEYSAVSRHETICDTITLGFDDIPQQLILGVNISCCEISFFAFEDQTRLSKLVGRSIRKIKKSSRVIPHEFYPCRNSWSDDDDDENKVLSAQEQETEIMHDKYKFYTQITSTNVLKIWVNMFDKDVCEAKSYDLILDDGTTLPLFLFTVSNGYYKGTLTIKSSEESDYDYF